MVIGILRGKRRFEQRPSPVPQLPRGAGMLSCRVVDPLDQPLRGAEVSVTDRATGRKTVSGTSDPYGLFVAALPPGRYSVLVHAEGMQPVSRTVEITAGTPTLLGPVQLLSAPPKEPPLPGTWLIDPPHTAIRFIARHVGLANIHGRFTNFWGTLHIAERPEESQAEVTIDASSIDTGNKTRDDHLRSADFLDVANYPYLHFVSDRFVFHGGSNWTVQGTLTLHGVSRSVRLATDYRGMVTGGYAEELRCAAFATAELHRDDFSLNYRKILSRGIAVIGPTVKLELDIQAMFQDSGTPTPPQ